MTRLGYRPALDGMRAIAIAPVVLLHAWGIPREGNLGVDIFFVLSGFLITTLLLEEHAEAGAFSLLSFYRRRAARLLPALAVLLIVCAAASAAARSWGLLFVGTYTTNIAMAVDLDAVGLPFNHLWSLAQEEQFYLLWPPLLLVLLRRRPRSLVRVLVFLIVVVFVERLLLVATGAGLYRIYLGPDTHAEPILVGCLFAALRGKWVPPRAISTMALGFVFSAFFIAQWTPWLTPVSPLRTLFFFACGVVVMRLGVASIQPLTVAPLVFLGQISYSLYLWHVPVLAATGVIVGTGPHPFGLVAASVAASVAVATGSFYIVERPLRRKLREARFFRPRPVTATTPAA